jgi:putative transposase
MRALHVNANALGFAPWMKKTPYDVRDDAVRDFLKALKTQKMLVAQGKRRCFMMKFRSKRRDQSITIHSKHWKSGHYFDPDNFVNSRLRAAEPLPETLNYDSRLIRDKCGNYFLCIPQPLDDHLAHTQENEIVALDPGVRTFMTGYDPSGKILEIGAKDMTRIYRLCDTMDDIQSRFQQPITKARKRYRLKRAWKHLQVRVRNLVDEVHKKTTLTLVKSYKIILLPKFETSQTYTSKTCGSCGHIHKKLGGNKVFNCPLCGVKLDRDVNGARNNLLKFLTEFHP